MSELHTFKDVNNRFSFTVKSEFLQKCPNPSTQTCYDLFSKFYLLGYIHNPKGPAVINLKTNEDSYWIDGRLIDVDSPEDAKKMRHNYEFNKKLGTIID